MGLEGIVSKRLSAPYRSGRSAVPPLLAELDVFRSRLEHTPGRPEAIRRLMELGLAAKKKR
jgi:hypothetical protein